IHALRHLEEKAGVKTAIVNCWERRTFYEILDDMIREFRILRAEKQRTGFKLEKLRSYLTGRPLVVLLDEIDQIKLNELSTVLYNLDSVLNAGLICISDSVQTLSSLGERVRSRLNPHIVFFPRYCRKELLDILMHRAEQALCPGSWSQDALKRITAIAHGDARVAIKMLRRAAILADHQRLHRISMARLKQQVRLAAQAERASLLNDLTQDHRMLYEIVKQKGQILSGDLWQDYVDRCTFTSRSPLSSRSFSDYANRLVQAGLVTSERARVKGKVRLFKIVK
ncbi:MAG: hypothetical protein JSU94_07125, partial [Phycisphaerales bacterium]